MVPGIDNVEAGQEALFLRPDQPFDCQLGGRMLNADPMRAAVESFYADICNWHDKSTIPATPSTRFRVSGIVFAIRWRLPWPAYNVFNATIDPCYDSRGGTREVVTDGQSQIPAEECGLMNQQLSGFDSYTTEERPFVARFLRAH